MVDVINIIRRIPFEPGIGDPTLFGWLTVAAYLAAAYVSVLCAVRAERIFGKAYLLQHRLIWGGLAVGLFFLGVNKQLDIQSWFTAVAKTIAYEQGWYEFGQQAQVLFIIGMVVASIIFAAGGAFFLRHVWRRYWILLIGLLFIARFIIVRAASFYGVQLPELSRFTGGIRVNWLLEISGAAVIFIAALLNLQYGKTGIDE